MADQERKSVERIALRFTRNPQDGLATQNEVVAMQGFLTASPWEAGDVFAKIRAAFADELYGASGSLAVEKVKACPFLPHSPFPTDST